MFTLLRSAVRPRTHFPPASCGPKGNCSLTFRPSIERLEDRALLSTENQLFLGAIYGDLLGRILDTNGLANWSKQLDGGTSRVEVVSQIANSSEYRSREVQGFYQRLLQRPADPGGLSSFVGLLNQGQTCYEVKATMLGSTEYYTKAGGGSNGGFLAALYRDVLGRPLDSAGASAWTHMLANGSARTSVAGLVIYSEEARQYLVSGCYRDYLGRPADPRGLSYWSTYLWSHEYVIAGLTSSEEYFASANVYRSSVTPQDVGNGLNLTATPFFDESKMKLRNCSKITCRIVTLAVRSYNSTLRGTYAS
jgi:hypothetical protein